MAVDKTKALETALTQIEKQFGKGAVMRLGENKHMSIDHISTGSLSLDIALGIGGLPKGRIVEIYGPESSGKTTLALDAVAEAQKQGGTAAFIDVEHALDPVYSKALGVDIDSLLVSQPDTGEQALEITEALVRSGALDVVVVDSVAALVPKAEIEGEMGDSHVGLHARLMSQALRKLAGAIGANQLVALLEKPGELMNYWGEIERQMEVLRNQLSLFCHKREEHKKTVSKEELSRQLGFLKNQIISFEYDDALKTAEILDGYQIPDFMTTMMELLQVAVLNGEIEETMKVITNLEEMM